MEHLPELTEAFARAHARNLAHDLPKPRCEALAKQHAKAGRRLLRQAKTLPGGAGIGLERLGQSLIARARILSRAAEGAI